MVVSPYPIIAALVVLLVFVVLVARQNRDLLRAGAYGELLSRLLPLLVSGFLVTALPFVMRLTTSENALAVLLLYLAGTGALAAFAARLTAPEERQAAAHFRREEYAAAAAGYERLAARSPLARHHSALAASLDASGDPQAALDAADKAVALDPRLGIAFYNRASARSALGDITGAREDLQTVFRVDNNRRLRASAEEAMKSLG